MPLTAFTHQATFSFLKWMGKLSWLRRGLVLVLTICLVVPAMAQPIKGSTYKDFLPMGSGASVALPEGSWLLTQNLPIARPNYAWDVYVLKNTQLDARIPFLVVRQAIGSVKWGNTGCQSKSATQFLTNLHGTQPNQIINKCSRFHILGDFNAWSNVASWNDARDKSWWINVVPGFGDTATLTRSALLLNELTIFQFNGKGLIIEAFIVPPKNISTRQFRDDMKEGQIKPDFRPEYNMLDSWAGIYIESMQQSYFNKKPQPIMALAYPVNTGGQTPAAPAGIQMAAAMPVTEDANVDRMEKEREQRTQELVRDMETASTNRPVAKPPAPTTTPVVTAAETVKPAPVAATKPAPLPAPVVKPASAMPAAPAPVVVADNSAQLRLEQERRAMEEDKRKMAQQLEAMTQMLAKLQQENAAAAAAAKAKEQAAAAPEPVAPKVPVTYANRKALVIGNDLYTHVSKLNNAGADAEAMAKSLEAVGYKVFKHLNLNEKKFKQAVRDFRQNLTGGDEVLFFYAGHGVQLGNANYLLPIDVQGDQEDQVKDDAILLQKVLDDLEEKKTKFALAVIDACRDNPFKSKGRAIGGRGLAPTSAATGQMIMFSAGSGQQALDRLGDNDKEKNGLFTRIFVKEMTKPGLSVDRVLRNVRNEVVRLARSVGHEQTPALYDQAIGEFYFKQ